MSWNSSCRSGRGSPHPMTSAMLMLGTNTPAKLRAFRLSCKRGGRGEGGGGGGGG